MPDEEIIWKLEPFPEPYKEERMKVRDEIYNYFISAQLPSHKAAIFAPCSKSTLETEIAQEYQRATMIGEANISISKSEHKSERSERLSWDGSHSILITGESDINVIIESGNGRLAARVGFFERE
ncbi:hypothetical protein ACJ73_05339 [Blastomyces percursus]|uniref:Uncharacterized protein n=1 Tax=Blastomyces percursus TaxID=1658174 RepID=A0A1J9R471_9EURO|nr:hypothetical protein ACJ73_05339 [Blastomyces percursus]